MENDSLSEVRNYFENTLKNHGGTARGVDWNSEGAREARFEQLSKIITCNSDYSILDYGSGYGALADYLDAKCLRFSKYVGYDIVEAMALKGMELHSSDNRISFTSQLNEIPVCDYATACGVFNMKLNTPYGEWTHFVIHSLDEMNALCTRGFSVNFLTKYSDPDRMRPDLYYADPCFLFDYCKTHYTKNVALLHDYNLFDFTLLIRKD